MVKTEVYLLRNSVILNWITFLDPILFSFFPITYIRFLESQIF